LFTKHNSLNTLFSIEPEISRPKYSHNINTVAQGITTGATDTTFLLPGSFA